MVVPRRWPGMFCLSSYGVVFDDCVTARTVGAGGIARSGGSSLGRTGCSIKTPDPLDRGVWKNSPVVSHDRWGSAGAKGT
jgi:hypothetical protein